ncbi:MAG: DUF3826 domain-containing protein [Chitinophagaceae bacterium]|nr:DUF3826 domain-containing protein [Chitinophagaceae bacterium]
MNRFRLAIQRLDVAALPAPPSFFSFPTTLILTRFLKFLLLLSILLLTVFAQGQSLNEQKLADYKKAIRERSQKIVYTLGITDSNKQVKLTELLSEQYFCLNEIHESAKTDIAAIKTKALAKEFADVEIKARAEKKSAALLHRHKRFVTQLKRKLTDEQVDKVKDGMTYRVFPITWAAYQEMLPNLTTEQKDRLYTWLKEARELAMDAESSEKKHAVFGKYKGKINNYLSAAGYDMKKEGEEWQKRVKQRAAQKSAPSN